MFEMHFDRDDRRGLFANVAAFVGAALLVNGIVFGAHLTHDEPSSTFAIPGPIVGAVWIALFASLGTARWLIVRRARGSAYRASWYVVGLALFCLSYAFYALPAAPIVGLFGNLATLLATLIVIARIPYAKRRATWFVAPIFVWVSIATISVAGLAGLR